MVMALLDYKICLEITTEPFFTFHDVFTVHNVYHHRKHIGENSMQHWGCMSAWVVSHNSIFKVDLLTKKG